MAKKLKSFRLSDESINALGKLCEQQNRSEANVIETLLLEAVKKDKPRKPK
jgi:hypothetical protein